MAFVNSYTDIGFLKRRLGAHRRRMRYWSGLPSFTNFGPTGRSCQSGYMADKYEEACCDAISIAEALQDQGVAVKVVDLRATFASRFNRPEAPEILIFPY